MLLRSGQIINDGFSRWVCCYREGAAVKSGNRFARSDDWICTWLGYYLSAGLSRPASCSSQLLPLDLQRMLLALSPSVGLFLPAPSPSRFLALRRASVEQRRCSCATICRTASSSRQNSSVLRLFSCAARLVASFIHISS